MHKRFDRQKCGPTSKPCGDVCIKRSYNCELYNEGVKGITSGGRARTAAGLVGLAALTGTAMVFGNPGQVHPAALGTAIVGGAAALGLGYRAAQKEKHGGSAVLAQAENEKNAEDKTLMKMYGYAHGGTEEYARQKGWMKGKNPPKQRRDSIWAVGFEYEPSESI